MRNIHHLKFVTGAFCTLIGVLVLSQGFTDQNEVNLNKTIGWGYDDHSIIISWGGVVLSVVGIILILLAFRKPPANKA